MWQQSLAPHVAKGELVVIGVVQEQHPDRARLYRQWRRLEWPILADPLNLLDLSVVPVPVAIDEWGIVQHEKVDPRKIQEQFLAEEYAAARVPADHNRLADPDVAALRADTGTDPLARGDGLFQYGEVEDLDLALESYQRATGADGANGRAWFRLGVAYRRRADGPRARPHDAQRAITAWERALATDPNQYIWRRRLQQYGPRLDKPYNFYFWVNEARDEIRARGEEPVALVSEPMGSEVSPPARPEDRSPATIPDPDPDAQVDKDAGLILVETMVTPLHVRAGDRVRVRVIFTPSREHKPWWNNESDPLTLHLDLPEGVSLVEGTFVHPGAKTAESREKRILECEVEVAKGVADGWLRVSGYALYSVCEDQGGVCRRLRADIEPLRLTVSAHAVRLR